MTIPSAEAMEKAKEVYHSWCEIDAEDNQLFDRLVGDIAQALEEYADTHYSDVLHKWAKANANAVTNARAEALEEAAKVAEFHSGPSIQLVEKIHALKNRGGDRV